jgi:hypothetical protein
MALLGAGQCILRGRLRGRRLQRWFYDNGAFEDWKQGRPFDVAAFERDLETVAASPEKPDFIVAPDIVGGGLESLALSLSWLERCAAVAPVYLAVQDGMAPSDLDGVTGIAGLFVGGGLPWKLATGEQWCAYARSRGWRAHIGRVGTARRVAWARDCGADSIDSSLPLWSRANERSFTRALLQQHLFS